MCCNGVLLQAIVDEGETGISDIIWANHIAPKMIWYDLPMLVSYLLYVTLLDLSSRYVYYIFFLLT